MKKSIINLIITEKTLFLRIVLITMETIENKGMIT